ncbi:hypothetical protein HZA57_09775 [Candidatus Poribacteria bacterium]|nr:hypothetical protein [Candidatus Poribacteria bacterium]
MAGGAHLLLAATLVLLLAGCSRLTVESTPPGAEVVWSADGVGNWHSWPPVNWSGNAPTSSTALTPLTQRGRYGDALWVTVRKEGFYEPRPQVVQLYTGRHEKLIFDLRETPDAYAARMREQGLVSYNGEWVDPAARGLVEFDGHWLPEAEAFVLSQQAKGLIEYKGEWLSPAEREARFTSDQQALGLVPFKNRWVTPEVQSSETALDAEVTEAAGGEHDSLEPPKVIGRIEARLAQVQLLNSTGFNVRFLLSGPESRDVLLAPYASYGLVAGERLSVPAGRYKVVAKPLTSGLGPAELPASLPSAPPPKLAFVEQPLAEGFQYLFNFAGGESLDLGDLEDEYKLKEPEVPFEIPSIEIPEVELPEPAEKPREGGREWGGRRPGGGGGGGRPPGGGGGRP